MATRKGYTKVGIKGIYNSRLNANALSVALIEPFDLDNSNNLGPRWDKWIKRLDQYFSAYGIDDDAKKLNTLFLFGGERLSEVHDTLPELTTEEANTANTEYKKSCAKLKKHFNPQRNTMVETFNFRSSKQCINETVESYVTSLRLLSKFCDFGDNQDKEITTQVVLSCHSTKFRRDLLKTKDLDLKKVIEQGRINDTLNEQVERVEGHSQININNERSEDRIEAVSKKKKQFSDKRKIPNQQLNNSNAKKCFKCAGSYPHEGSCPAIGKKCRKCDGLNHYAVCCRVKSDHKEKVEQVSSFNSDRDWEEVFALGKGRSPGIILNICNEHLNFRIDTCASVNVLDESNFHKIKNKLKLKEYIYPLFAYSNVTLKTIGKFTTTLTYKGKKVVANFVVTEGNGGCLLSYKTSLALNLIDILCEENEVICSIEEHMVKETVNNKKEYWEKRYPEVFKDELGKLKNFKVKLHIDKDVKPIQAKIRHKPFHLRQAIEAEIKNKLESGVIEKVENEPTEWLSEIVVVPKKGTNEIRICTDMSSANTAIKREKYEMPNIEDIVYQANEAKYFSKLDLNKAFEQLELHPESRHISRFRTHTGIYQHKRLFFGVNSAPEIFHNKIRLLLEGIEGAQNATDDILIMSKTQAEDFKTTEKVLDILKSNGLTINKRKSVFSAKEIEYFGLKFSDQGVSLNEFKTKALKEFKTPENASVLHSFLGLCTYCSRWIKNLAELTEPLWKLTKKSTKFEWTPFHQSNFDKIKSTLIDKVGYFRLNWDTELTVDASPIGLGATLTQTNPNKKDEKVVICYVSRLLSESEKRYSQLEREALVLPWAFERLDLYLLGRQFKVYTDNRAVALIFNNPLSNPPAVIKRWRLRMEPFQFKIIHRAGLGNISDFLSRHPLKEKIDLDYIGEKSEYINLITTHNIPSSIGREVVLEKTQNDDKLSKLSEMVKKKRFIKKSGVDEYSQIFGELTVSEEGFLLKDDKLIIPECLVQQVIDLAHEGHLGIVKTKQLLRSNVWFPKINEMVENQIKNCLACQACDKTHHKITPLAMSEMPSAPWENLSVDFYGPIYPTNQYLIVIIDDYSRFPIVIDTFSLKSENIEFKLELVFSEFGIPKVLRSDNGPPFSSSSFKQFCKTLGVSHRLITPLWPRANGIGEAFMKNLSKVIQTAIIDKVSWKKRLIEFLRNYRGTPHSSTGVAPSALLFRNPNPCKLLSYKRDFIELKLDRIAKQIDLKKKLIMKKNADKSLHTGSIKLVIGDLVLVKQKRQNKTMSYFNPNILKIVQMKGNMVTASNGNYSTTKNISFFKKWEGKSKDEIKLSKGNSSIPSKAKLVLKNQGVLLFPEGQVNQAIATPRIENNVVENRPLGENIDSEITSNADVGDNSGGLSGPGVNNLSSLDLNEGEHVPEQADQDSHSSSDTGLGLPMFFVEEKTLSFIDDIEVVEPDENAQDPKTVLDLENENSKADGTRQIIQRKSDRNKDQSKVDYKDNRKYNKKK